MNKQRNIEIIKRNIESIKSIHKYNVIEVIIEHMQDLDIDDEIQHLAYSIFDIDPEEDNDYLWTLMHFIEKIPNSEHALLKSIIQKKTIFTVRMIGRCINSNINQIDGINLRDYLLSITNDLSESKIIREEARQYI